MKNAYRIRQILEEIERLEDEIGAGEKAWEDGDDPFAMAECDPSDQFVKSREIDDLKAELKELVAEL